MGETDSHIAAIVYLLGALRRYFRNAEQIYAAANMLLYYEEGNPAACVVPDVFVVKGVGKHPRRTFKLWEERVAPCVVFEITSRSSRLEDLGNKRALYEMLRVKEYFLFDPLNEYLDPRLQGFRLTGSLYQPISLQPDGTVGSDETGLILKADGELLRLIDSESGSVLPTLDEVADRMETEAQRVETEAQRADAEARRAEAEARRADQAEAEIVRLRAELKRRQE